MGASNTTLTTGRGRISRVYVGNGKGVKGCCMEFRNQEVGTMVEPGFA